MRVNRPAGAIKREAGTDWPVMSRQANHAADQFETRSAPNSAASRVRALVKVRIQLAMRIETVQRTQSQNDIDGGQNDVCLGSGGMSAAFLVELHVCGSGGVNCLQARFYLPWCSRAKLDLPKREAELPVPMEPSRRHHLRYAALQVRARGKDQVMVSGEQRLRHDGPDRRAQVLGCRAQWRHQ